MLNALEVFTTVVVGVMVGVEFSVPFFITRSSTHSPATTACAAASTGPDWAAP